jgi:hypothetical protein
VATRLPWPRFSRCWGSPFSETQVLVDYLRTGPEQVGGGPVAGVAITFLRVVGWPLVGLVTDVPETALLEVGVAVVLVAVGLVQARGTIVPVALVLFAITVPWLGLWIDWIAQLTRNTSSTIAGAQMPIPLAPRLIVATGLLIVIRRPWARGLAAIVAIPAPYWVSSILLLGLIPPIRRPDSG